jgi:hypothetical protein
MRIINSLKDNFYTVVKLWVNQFAMVFLGILVLLPTGGDDAPVWLMPVASAFTALFYLVLLFWACCELGLQHSVSINIGKSKASPTLGLVVSLAANLPSILCSIVACVSKAFLPVPYLESAADATGLAADFYGIATIINEILHMMYKGMLIFFDINKLPFIHLPIAALSILVCTLGYIAGTKGFLASLFAQKRLD